MLAEIFFLEDSVYVVRKKGPQGKFRWMKYSWGYFINHKD